MEVFVALTRAGYAVLTAPFTDNLRYDCVIDDGDRLRRVQIKSGRLRRGVVRFATASIDWYRRRRRDYHGSADLFAVWCPDTRQVYLVPVSGVGKTDGWLRLDAPKNGQTRGVRWAADYILTPLAERPAKRETAASVRESMRPWLRSSRYARVD